LALQLPWGRKESCAGCKSRPKVAEMNRRLLTILLCAFVVAAGCSFLVYKMIGNRVVGAQIRTTRVVVAAADVKLGSVLRDADLGTAEMSGTLPKGAILRREDAVGRGVVSDLYQGEPVLESRLAALGSGGGLAATIHPGMRACAVRVDEVVGVAGFVTPGQKVDVLISGTAPGAASPAEGPEVRTLLQNIQVLSAGTDIQKDGEGKPQQVQVVNLLVTPEQAEALSLASNQTRIQLVLRNPLDTETTHTSGTGVAALFADPNAAPKPKPVAKAPSAPRPVKRIYLVEVFNGSKHSETKFPAGEEKQ
jgi:pilus assembly protein CpaB